MEYFNVVRSRRQIRNRKLAVVVGHGVIGIIDDDDVRLHPAMDCTLDIERASLLDLAFIYLALYWLRNVEEAVLAFEKLNVVQYRVIVLQRDLGIHRHYLNVG